jgi:hypothetical protein
LGSGVGVRDVASDRPGMAATVTADDDKQGSAIEESGEERRK